MIKQKKMSIRFKILIPAAAMVVAMGLIMGITTYFNIQSAMVDMGVEEAGMAAGAAIDVIDGDLISLIVPGCEGGEPYNTLLNDMRKVQENFGIAFLYTLYTDGEQVYYGVDTDDSSNQSAVGTEFESSYEELSGVFHGETYAQDYIDYTDDGMLITAYLPIRDSKGNIAGILGCDYDAAGVVARLRTAVMDAAIVAFLCTLAGLVAINLIVRQIVNNLQLVSRKVYDLVHSDGDTAQQLDVQTGDELQDIAENVNTVLQNIWEQSKTAREVARGNLTVKVHPASEKDMLGNALKQLVWQNGSALRGIRNAAKQARTGSAQMVNASDSLAKSSMDQAGAIEEINAAMNTVAEQTRKNSITSEQAVQRISKAIDLVDQGNSQMQSLVSAMNEINQASADISSILNSIEEIASQTNLLAVNASIEATRAGETGKGFMIIAQHIRQLATNCSEAAARTSVLVEASVTKAKTGGTLADETAASLSAITEVVTQCVEMIHSIASASSEQSASIQEIDRAMDQVSQVVQTNSSISQQCADASTELSRQMDIVDQMLGVYQLE